MATEESEWHRRLAWADIKHFDKMCDKCGKIVDDLPWHFSSQCSPPSELQLLVIDLGKSTLVKVEKAAAMTDLPYPVLCVGNGLDTAMSIFEGNSYYFRQCKFDQIRAAIDNLGGEKPVPRIERTEQAYRVHVHESFCKDISKEVFDALSELAGKKLLIYEPKKGEWTRLPSTSEYMGDPLESIGIAIWRYTRGV